MLCLLVAVMTTLSSCLKDDNDSSLTSYSDMAITSFTLGTLNRYQQTTSTKTGNDTIVKSTFTGSYYPMTIDQINYRIYNTKPLPIGTDSKHVICTINTKNNGVVYVKSLTSDTLTYYTSTDSLDLSSKRIFRVFAINGSGSRDYTVELNVSQTTGTTFQWVKTDSVAPADNFASKRLVAFGNTTLLLDRNIMVKGNYAFRLNDGSVERSDNLEQWEQRGDATELQQLVGTSSFELFAIGNDGRMKRSTDDGMTWQDELLDEDASLLPSGCIATTYWPYSPTNNTDYVLMVGNLTEEQPRQSDEQMNIWRKISTQQEQGQWVCMTQDYSNHEKLPRFTHLSLAYYDGTVLALGNDLKIYQSRDQGITWQQPADFALPSTLIGTAASITADDNDALWLITDKGQIWKGSKL